MRSRRNNAASGRLALAAALAGIAGCATAPAARPDPTHHWISKTVESQVQYQYDSRACAAAAGDESVAASDGDGRRRDAPAFVVYERCMGERGYELATY